MKIYKPITIVIIALLALVSSSRAQLNIVYDSSFTMSKFDTVFALALTSENDILVVGATDTLYNDTVPRSQMFLLKVRSGDGDSMTSAFFELDTIFMINDFTRLSSGDFLLPGWWQYDGRIFKVNPDLEITDTCKANADSLNYYTRVMEMPNGDIMALHDKALNKNFTNILRMSSSWDTVWQTDYQSEDYNGIAYYNEEKLIISGWDNNNEYPHPTVTSYTENGEFLHYEKINEVYAFNKNIFIDTNTFVLMNLKEKILGGTVGNLVKTNDLGEYLWYEDLDAPKSVDINDLVLYNDYIITVSNTQKKDTIAFSVIDGEGTLINYLKMGFVEPVLAGMELVGDMIIVAGTQNDTLDTLGLRKQVFVGAVMIDSSWFSITVGKGEIIFADGVSVYPNPSTGTINIAIEKGDPFEEKTALLFNSSGLLVEEFRFTGTHYQNSIDHLQQGLYFVKLVLPDGTTNTQKIVLMR
ncbi:MAG TPA: T9SS type A sorting domain-containing protein [Bacteroidales bacterium]|nr:T9SS type A sorting domain-containing protein [Bacteroidales bacterium]HRX96258.1 T9SS type A sorting domain-containing protein [Bacteroidales bacterium]